MADSGRWPRRADSGIDTTEDGEEGAGERPPSGVDKSKEGVVGDVDEGEYRDIGDDLAPEEELEILSRGISGFAIVATAGDDGEELGVEEEAIMGPVNRRGGMMRGAGKIACWS